VDRYTYGGLGGTPTIAGIQINTAVRETDGISHPLITEVVSNGTPSDDAGQTVGTQSYVNKKRIVEVDPATTQAWTLAALNSAQIGIKAG
jgi:hypothetical protein